MLKHCCGGEIVIFRKRSKNDMDCECTKCKRWWQWDDRTLKNEYGEVDHSVVYDGKPRYIIGAD